MINAFILTLLTIILFCCILIVQIELRDAGEPINVYIVVTATPTPTYEMFENSCPSYCPTPYPIA